MTIERRRWLAEKLLDVVADATVGDWMHELGDCPAGKAYAAFLARLVEVRDEATVVELGRQLGLAVEQYLGEAL